MDEEGGQIEFFVVDEEIDESGGAATADEEIDPAPAADDEQVQIRKRMVDVNEAGGLQITVGQGTDDAAGQFSARDHEEGDLDLKEKEPPPPGTESGPEFRGDSALVKREGQEEEAEQLVESNLEQRRKNSEVKEEKLTLNEDKAGEEGEVSPAEEGEHSSEQSSDSESESDSSESESESEEENSEEERRRRRASKERKRKREEELDRKRKHKRRKRRRTDERRDYGREINTRKATQLCGEDERIRSVLAGARFFLIKSANARNVQISKDLGVWATSVRNERVLMQAFKSAPAVILVFSVEKSMAFQGFARLSSEADSRLGPVAWQLPPGLRNGRVLGHPFRVAWCTKKELHFDRTSQICNMCNENKPVKIGRDGTEIDARAGLELCSMFPFEGGVDLRIKHTERSSRRRVSSPVRISSANRTPFGGPPVVPYAGFYTGFHQPIMSAYYGGEMALQQIPSLMSMPLMGGAYGTSSGAAPSRGKGANAEPLGRRAHSRSPLRSGASKDRPRRSAGAAGPRRDSPERYRHRERNRHRHRR